MILFIRNTISQFIGYIIILLLFISTYIHTNKIQYWKKISNYFYSHSLSIENYNGTNIILLKQFMNEELISYIKEVIPFQNLNYINSSSLFSPNSLHFLKNYYLQLLLLTYLPYIELITKHKLIPIYANIKIYKDDSVLFPHKDHSYLEYTITINITEQSHSNLLFYDKGHFYNITLTVGDAILFKGSEIYHARCTYSGSPFCQILLHYMSEDIMKKKNLHHYQHYYKTLLE